MRAIEGLHNVVSMTACEGESVLVRAQRLVSRQAGCSLQEALGLMQDTATASDVSLPMLAECVLDGSVTFDED